MLALAILSALITLIPSGATAQEFFIEYVENVAAANSSHSFIPPIGGVAPAKGQTVTDPVTGLTITRLTDTNDAIAWRNNNPTDPPSNLPASVFEVDGIVTAGITNGYCKYTNMNRTGEYYLGYHYNQLLSLYRASDNAHLGVLSYNQTNGFGESNEPRWSRLPGEETSIYYRLGSGIYRQNVLEGYTTQERVWSPPEGRTVVSTGAETDLSWDGRYMAVRTAVWNGSENRFEDYQIGVLDLVERRASAMIPIYADAVEISPLGTWFFINNSPAYLPDRLKMYRISDMMTGTLPEPVLLDSGITNTGAGLNQSIGHNGWGFDHDGNEVLFFQDNKLDNFAFFNPVSGEKTVVIDYAEFGWSMGQHVGTIHNPAIKGWAFMSTYTGATDGWSYNQLFMIELLPKALNPRVWRLGATQHVYGGGDSKTGRYFTEAFASISDDGTKIHWGSNWNQTDNLELYQLNLPEEWWVTLNEDYTPRPTPTPGPDPTPTPEPTPQPGDDELAPGTTIEVINSVYCHPVASSDSALLELLQIGDRRVILEGPVYWVDPDTGETYEYYRIGDDCWVPRRIVGRSWDFYIPVDDPDAALIPDIKIDYADTLNAPVGAYVTLWGISFGDAGDGSIQLGSTAVGGGDIVEWTDRRITFRVPAGAASGDLSVSSILGTSNALAFTVRSGDIFYVNTQASNASDTNAGTEAQPWKTLTHAAQTVQAGDTVYVAQGIYNETLEPANSGTEAEPIMFKALPGQEVLLEGEGLGGTPDGIRVEGATMGYLTFSGFHLRNYDETVHILQGAHDCNLYGIKATLGRGGLLLYGASKIFVAQSEFSNNDDFGVVLNNFSSDILIQDSSAHHNASEVGGGFEADFSVSNVTIFRCTSYSNVGDGYDVRVNGLVLHESAAWDNANGARLWRDSHVQNSYFYNNVGSGIICDNFDNTNPTQTIVNCTVAGDHGGAAIEVASGVDFGLRNTIAVGALGPALLMADTPAQGAIAHSILQSEGAAMPAVVVAQATNAVQFTDAQVGDGTFASQAGQGPSLRSVEDPADLFVNYDRRDLRLVSASAARDYGTDTGAPGFDYHRNPRGGNDDAFDVGAFEYDAVVLYQAPAAAGHWSIYN